MLGSYDALCAQGKRDPRDQMNWLLEQLEDGDFGENHVFYIDGFPDFTRQHLAILEHLIKVSPSVTVGLNCDKVDSSRMAFEKAGDTAAQLIRCARHAGVEVKIEIVKPAPIPLMPIRQALFQGPLPEGDCSGTISAVQADSAYSEVLAVAEKIMDLVRGGSRYRDISVVCTDMTSYKSLCDLVFHRCGIPLYQSGTEDILSRTVIATVLSAMEAALGGFDRKDVLRYLKSVLSPLEQDVCDKVENYAVLWGIRGNRWLIPWENHPDGFADIMTEADQERLDQLNKAREIAMAPL